MIHTEQHVTTAPAETVFRVATDVEHRRPLPGRRTLHGVCAEAERIANLESEAAP